MYQRGGSPVSNSTLALVESARATPPSSTRTRLRLRSRRSRPRSMLAVVVMWLLLSVGRSAAAAGEERSPRQRSQSPLLEEAEDNGAVDDRPGRAERLSAGAGYVTLLGETKDAELLEVARAVAAVDCLLGPLVDVGVPQRAVIGGDRRNPTEDVERAEAILDGAVQPLALWVVLARGAVGCDEDTLDRAEGTVIATDGGALQARSERGALERGDGRRKGVRALAGPDAALGAEVDGATLEAEGVATHQRRFARAGPDVYVLQLGREEQAQRIGLIGVGRVGQDVPDRIVVRKRAAIQGQFNLSRLEIGFAGAQEFQGADQLLLDARRGRTLVGHGDVGPERSGSGADFAHAVVSLLARTAVGLVALTRLCQRVARAPEGRGCDHRGRN